jgi:signal transduction histidine kinase/CheY-like chemotaxis protein
MFGCSAAELVGRSVAELVDGRYESPRQCLEHLRASALNRVTEWRARRANGETFTCELSLFEFTATDGTRHFAGHILDVSERQEVDRMKKDFVATVSHELRTPLTSIRGSLGLMASGVMGELTPEARQMVSVAERNSVRLIALINDILDFEKLENGRMELELRPTPLQRLLERSVEAVSAVASQEGIEIQLRCPNALVRGDEARLMQVIVNLLSNALKYSDRGGLVTVDAAVDTEWAVIRVSDHGRGIAPHLHKRLFQRFEQLDPGDARTRPGTGLGLAICKAIVEQHGGSVGVESHEGQGSTFWFRVPSVDMTEQARASGEPHRADVLLVEDDAALLEVMSTQLAASGVPVRTARSGASGLAAVAERAPGLIVLDVDLPDIDGFGVVEALRGHPKHSSVPLLVYSALDLSIADRRRLTLGPTRYLLKSRASDDDFCSAVGQLLDAEARSELM